MDDDGSPAKWKIESSSGEPSWHRARHRSVSAPFAWYYGIDSSRNFDNGSRNWGRLTTVEPVDLTGAVNPTLAFREWVEYQPFYDRTRVQVSEDQSKWTTIFKSHRTTGQKWENRHVNLSSYIGKRIYLRFDFDSIDSRYNKFEGWYLDNITVCGGGNR